MGDYLALRRPTSVLEDVKCVMLTITKPCAVIEFVNTDMESFYEDEISVRGGNPDRIFRICRCIASLRDG